MFSRKICRFFCLVLCLLVLTAALPEDYGQHVTYLFKND